MTNAATMATSPALIEEHVDSGLKELLGEYRPTYVPGGAAIDELEKRYFIDTSKRIPTLSHSFADAYEAKDKNMPARMVYAMVCNPELPYRTQAVADAHNFNNPHFQSPIAHGTVRCSHLNEARYVLFFEKLEGQSLAQLSEVNARIHESKVIPTILAPICQVLLAMRERKFYHGNIRPEIFFLGETPILGECFSAAPGTVGHYLYESLERMMADPMGHGDADEKSDIYALGMLVFDALYGLDKFKEMPRQEFILRALRQGTYNVLAGERDFPPLIQDFLRASLTDNVAERWGLDQLAQFIEGKRFNVIMPAAARDAARPLIFMDEPIVSRRFLAHTLHQNWRETVKDIRSLNLERWCETSLHRPELAELIERSLRIGADRTASARQVGDMMTRIFASLDPIGPMRSRTISLRPDSMGLMLACMIPSQDPELDQVLGFIESDLSSFWSERAQAHKNPSLSQVIWRLQRIKPFIKNTTLGFGLERALYDMNPTLPCQSPMLKPYHITTAEDALRTLDVLAKTHSDRSFVDQHLAAFLASKIEMTKPLKLTELTNIVPLQNDPELYMLRMLSKVQQKTPSLKLPGLSSWIGIHVERMLNEIHNRTLRKEQKLKLRRRASQGSILDVLMVLVNRDIGEQDREGYVFAMAKHELNFKQMQHLQNPLIVEYRSKRLGGQLSTMISYAALGIMVLTLINRMIGD